MLTTVCVKNAEFEVEFDVTAYLPARIHGRPEDCSPAEGGEVEIEAVMLAGDDFDLRPYLSDSVIENIAADITRRAHVLVAAERRAEEEDRAADRGWWASV